MTSSSSGTSGRAALLAGVRVLDLTQFASGPYCTMLLGDLGADIVKVEPPGRGDQVRGGIGMSVKGTDSTAFLALNRNKRSIALDLKSAEGLALFDELVRSADVVVENFRPGVAERLGVHYDRLRTLRADLVYASISGFGQDGPYAERPGFDLIAQAMAGLMSITGTPDGQPVKCGVPIGDLGAGLFAACGILAACLARTKTGEGQYLETSLYDAVLALAVYETAQVWSTGEVPGPLGAAHRLSAPYEALRTKDGHVVVAANNERMWADLCRVLGVEALVGDERFAGNSDRLRNRHALARELEDALAARPTAEWVELLLAAGVPAGPIQDYGQVLADEHTHARGMVQTVEHPVEGDIRLLGAPIKTRGGSQRPAAPPPLLGEHGAELLAELGMSPERIADLRAAGALG